MNNSKSNTAAVWTIVIVIILIIIGAVIWYNHSNSYSTPAATTASTQSVGTQSAAPMIPYYTLAATTSPALGNYLVAWNGMALYTYSKDSSGMSNCTASCASAWPPYTVSSSMTPTMSTAVTGHIAFISRGDGTTQVTYNGRPLYFFASDTSPASVTGNNVGGFTVAKP